MPKVKQPLTEHHRKCRSKGGSNSSHNISMVPQHKHQAYHLLFANHEPPEIARILNNIYIDPDWELIPIRKRRTV